MSSVKNCGKSSAFKTVKGFTLIELIIVIAIIAILAGISSIFVQGYVRDARLETANNKAQQVYTAMQNALVQFEIDQDYKAIDPSCIKKWRTGVTSVSESAKYVYLGFELKQGSLNGADVSLTSDNESSAVTYGSSYNFPLSSNDYPSATDNEGRAFVKLAKYLCDNLADDFTGYAYLCIDMENWVVDSAVFTENADAITSSANGVKDFANTYNKSGSTVGKNITGCDNITDQKTKYAGKDSSHVSAGGTVVGFYPMMNDMPSGRFIKN